jgi:hypothetical protein
VFEQAFKNIDDVLWKEAGCTTELDYTEQTSWLLFLKYLDALEQDRATEAKLEGKRYAGNLGKTNPLGDDDLAEFVKLQKKSAASPKSWSVDAKGIDKQTFDLSVKNPDGGEEVTHRRPEEILEEIARGDAECAEVLGKIRGLL